MVDLRILQESPIPIIIDTREQRPWNFASKSSKKGTVQGEHIIRRKLDTADYSIDGFEEKFCIERKSLNDLANTIGKPENRKRFFKELGRMKRINDWPDGFACIIVECDMTALLVQKYASNMSPNALMGFICGITMKYGIPVYFAGHRANAVNLAYSLIKMYWRWQTKDKK